MEGSEEKKDVLTEAMKLKNEGNEHFKRKEFVEALESYGRGLELLEGSKYNEEMAILHFNTGMTNKQQVPSAK